jgi:hypothetical protein
MARDRLDLGSSRFGQVEDLWLYLFAKRISILQQAVGLGSKVLNNFQVFD